MKEHRHIFHNHSEPSPSRFEGDKFLQQPNWASSAISKCYTGISHLDWVLSSQGDFLSLYQKTNETIMECDGPLPRSWRHYIAMLGASRHSCEYIARHQLERYISSGGEPTWFTDSDSIPKKLSSLSSINSVMAHKPWAIESSHIEYLMTTGRWSASELVHALVILATYQSLPSLVFGSGVKLESDLTTDEEYASTSSMDPVLESELDWDELAPLPRCFTANDSAPSLIQRLLQQATPSGSGRSTSSGQRGTSTDEPISAFEGFGALNETTGSGQASPASTAAPIPTRSAPKLGEEEKGELASIMASQPKWRTPLSSILRDGDDSEYRDFYPKTDKTLHTMTFSWEDHGMMVMARQLSEATDCINEEHAHALEFTTNSIGDQTIESTTTVREAIVKYVQRMYGLFHDDYRYDRLNKILPVIHKAYLKKLACYPERLTRVDYLRMRQFEGFTPKDLIHVAHLVRQTKRIVTLTWAMKAVMHYQGGTSD